MSKLIGVVGAFFLAAFATELVNPGRMSEIFGFLSN